MSAPGSTSTVTQVSKQTPDVMALSFLAILPRQGDSPPW
jgi:hypothetical protein